MNIIGGWRPPLTFAFGEVRYEVSDNVIAAILLIGIYIGLPVSLLVVRDWLRRPSRKTMEEYSKRFIERLHHPDFGAVQEHFGRPLPACVQALYANHEELLREDFETAANADASPEHRWYVAFYQPADDQSVKDTWPGLEKYFAFADDGCGNGYLIDPREEDPAVFFHDHETGEVTRISDSFSEFMKWPRLEAKA